MRRPRSAAPDFAARRSGVLAPSAMAVKISSLIPAFSAAVCGKALSVSKIRSGVGRLVVNGAAIKNPPRLRFGRQRVYTRNPSKRSFLGAKRLPGNRSAAILSPLPRDEQEAIDET